MLNCCGLTVTRLYDDKKLLFWHKEVTTYLLEFLRINTFHMLHQGVNSQSSSQDSFQVWSLAMESKIRLLNHSIIHYFKKLKYDFKNKMENIKHEMKNIHSLF